MKPQSLNRHLINVLKMSLCFSWLVMTISGCATARPPALPVPTGVLLRDVCDHNHVTWHWDSLSHVITLSLQDHKAKVIVGTDFVLVGETMISLSAPVNLNKSAVFVPVDFEEKVLEELKKVAGPKLEYSFKKVREIVLDAGHGGKDPGAIGVTGLQEKDVVLAVAKMLKEILEKQGLKVIMTRDDDTFISLQERTEIASRSNADLFISVHANTSPSSSVDGVEVYSLRELGPQEKNEPQRKENHHALFNHLAMVQDDQNLNEILADLLYSYKQTVTEPFAANVAQTTANFIKSRNRGLKHAQFYVLRNTLIPAILVEVGFLSNPQEEKSFYDNAFREKVADGLAKSVLEYVHD